jgi:hypothetical protein
VKKRTDLGSEVCGGREQYKVCVELKKKRSSNRGVERGNGGQQQALGQQYVIPGGNSSDYSNWLNGII